MSLGYSFQPDQEKRLRQGLNGGASGLSPAANQAIRLISLRLPNVLGGSPIAPDALLKPSVGGAGGGSPTSVVSNVARAVSGGTASGPAPAPPEIGSASGDAMASPVSNPFTTIAAPAAAPSSAETRAFTSMVNNAVSTPTPAPHFSAENGSGVPEKQGPVITPEPGSGSTPNIQVTPTPAPSDVQSLMDLLFGKRDFPAPDMSGSFGNEG